MPAGERLALPGRARTLDRRDGVQKESIAQRRGEDVSDTARASDAFLGSRPLTGQIRSRPYHPQFVLGPFARGLWELPDDVAQLAVVVSTSCGINQAAIDFGRLRQKRTRERFQGSPGLVRPCGASIQLEVVLPGLPGLAGQKQPFERQCAVE